VLSISKSEENPCKVKWLLAEGMVKVIWKLDSVQDMEDDNNLIQPQCVVYRQLLANESLQAI